MDKPNKISVQYDSYQISDSFLKYGDYRNNEVDFPLVVPYQQPSRLIFTAADTIHSFFLPDFGIKVDCVPGRLNQTIIHPKKIGVFYGYCAELCGVNHRFMPITIEVIF